MPSIDTIIDDLSYLSLLQDMRQMAIRGPSDFDRDLERLRFTVREGYEDERIPPWAIRKQADDDRDARLQAAATASSVTLTPRRSPDKHARIKALGGRALLRSRAHGRLHRHT